MQEKVFIYTATLCHSSNLSKRLLSKVPVEFIELNIDGSPSLRDEMIQRTRKRKPPQIFIGEQHIGGFEELFELEKSNKLQEMLFNK